MFGWWLSVIVNISISILLMMHSHNKERHVDISYMIAHYLLLILKSIDAGIDNDLILTKFSGIAHHQWTRIIYIRYNLRVRISAPSFIESVQLLSNHFTPSDKSEFNCANGKAGAKSHASRPNSCWDISAWTKVVDQPNDTAIHRMWLKIRKVCK